METIRNIYCIGRNYTAHAKELDNPIPDAPFIFLKPSHSAIFTSENRTISLPGQDGVVDYEEELVVQLKKDYHPNLPLESFLGEIALGIDFTLREVQTETKKKGLPWLSSKGFRHSAVLSKSISFTSEENFLNLSFSLLQNEKVVQVGEPRQMIFSLRVLLDHIWRKYGLQKGDIVFTGTPAGVGAVKDQDSFTMKLNDETLGTFKVLLNDTL